MSNATTKTFLAVALFLCLLNMPFWYFQLIRIGATLVFAYLAIRDYNNHIRITPIIYGVAVIMFNPIFKVAFHRNEWNIIDIVFGVILLISIFLEPKLKISKV
jgi:hypothetical protein